MLNQTLTVPISNTNTPPLFAQNPTAFSDFVPKYFDSGNYRSFLSMINLIADKDTKTVLGGTTIGSDPLLKRFLAGDDSASATFFRTQVAEASRIDYSKLGNVLLSSTSGTTKTYKTIVDTYFVGILGNISYTFSPTTFSSTTTLSSTNKTINHLISDSRLGNSASTPEQTTTVLGRLLADGFLITKAQLYRSGDFSSTDTTPQGSKSLYWLMTMEASGTGATTPITSEGILQKNKLLAKNLRFFGAFLIEYCYYKAIYYQLIRQFYTIYNAAETSVNYTTDGIAAMKPAPITPANPPTKTNYIEVLLYQMGVLNTRLIDMRRLLGVITDYYNAAFSEISATFGANSNTLGSTTNLQQAITAMNASTDEVAKYNQEKDMRQEIIQYTQQKNRYANMLLALYAFLNISAVAAIFHVYKT